MTENVAEGKMRKTILVQRIIIVGIVVIFCAVYILSFNIFAKTKQNQQVDQKISPAPEKPQAKPVEEEKPKESATKPENKPLDSELPKVEKSLHDEILEQYQKTNKMSEEFISFQEEYFGFMDNVNMTEEDLISLFEDNQLEKIRTEIEIHLNEIENSILTKSYDSHLKALLLYSIILRSEFNHDDAIENLSKAEDFLPEIDNFALKRAYYLEMGKNFTSIFDFQSAIDQYTKLINLSKNLYLGYYLRGMCHNYRNEFDLTLKDFETQIKLEDIQEDINLDHYEEACIISANIYKLNYNTAKAIEYSRKSLEYNEEKIENYILIADLYMFIENYKSAAEFISDAELLDGKNSDVILANCRLLREYEKNYEQALILVNNLLYESPEDYVAYNERGMIYTNLKLYQAAFADFNKAISIAPMYANAYANRGWIYFKYKNQRDRALSDYNNSILLDTNLEYAYINRGVLLMESYQNNAKAIEDFNQALKIKPRYYLAYVNRGIAKRRLNETKGAIADFVEASKIDEENYIAFFQLGKTYAETSEYEKAKDTFTEALDRNDEIWELYFERAKCFLKLNKKDKAEKDLLKAGSLNSQLVQSDDFKKLLIDTME